MVSAEIVDSIPIVDARDGGPVHDATLGHARARALRDDCVSWLPAFAVSLLPAMDLVTRRWLLRSPSPYFAEIHAIAAKLGYPGVWFLNGCYQWGCTAPTARGLPCPAPLNLGKHCQLAKKGPARRER